MSLENLVETDVLVIGGGIAGCLAAIKAREQGMDVTIVDKAYAGKSGASISPPAGMMAFNPEWSVDFDVVMNAFNMDGEYINNRDWCEIILRDSWAIHQDLVSWGVKFPPFTAELAKMMCPPYTNVPIPFRGISPVPRKQAKKVGVRIMDRIMVTDLLKQDGKVVGAVSFSIDSGDLYIFKAKATVLSGGGNSFKPAGFPISMLTGDAEAMAYRAGAEITGKEFNCTTHPTRAIHPAALYAFRLVGPPPFFGLKDAQGEEQSWGTAEKAKAGEPDLSLNFVIHAGKGPIISDFDAVPEQTKESFRSRFQQTPTGKVPLAGGAAAGYGNVGTGGVWVIDTKCATSLPGLYAAGDCGGTRHNGALIVNIGGGTCPSAVIGRRAGEGAAEYALQTEKPIIDEEELARLKKIVYVPMERKSGFSPRWVTQLLQNTMIPYFISFIKHGERLQAALTIVEFLRDQLVPKLLAKDAHEVRLAHETKNMVLNAEMILRASIFRTESRGAHYREDYPRRDDPAWLAWVKIKEEQGRMKLLKEPVPKEWWPDLSKPYEERYPMRFPGE
jgi:succinate dehydrogenase/fumarate reductase flavoprotein subunit